MLRAKGLPEELPVRGSKFEAAVIVFAGAVEEFPPSRLSFGADADDEEELFENERMKEAPPLLVGATHAVERGGERRRWVVQQVATLPGATVAVLWAVENCPRVRASLQRMRALNIVRGLWPVVRNAQGERTVPSLNSDDSALAVSVRAAWPQWWRRRRAGDSAGDPMNGVPAALPTGALLVLDGLD